jgi:hypothetical protein
LHRTNLLTEKCILLSKRIRETSGNLKSFKEENDNLKKEIHVKRLEIIIINKKLKLNQEINDEIESENKKLKNQVNIKILKFINNTFKNSKYIEKVC